MNKNKSNDGKNKRERKTDNSEAINNINVVDSKPKANNDQFVPLNPKIVTDGVLLAEPRYEDEDLKINNKNEEPNKVLENTRPLNKDEETYKLETFKKNVLYIINQKHIIGFDPREGTQYDVAALKKVFGKFNFEFRDCDDLTEKEIFNKLNEIKSEDFSEYGCLGIVVMTHGKLNRMLWAKDVTYSEDELLRYFKSNVNPSLVTKPKFLIVQACRGINLSPGMHAGGAAALSTDGDGDIFEAYTIPVEADILVLHSTYYGCCAFRVADEGSWFIQELCKSIEEFAHKLDFDAIILKMKRKVAIDMTHKVKNRDTNEVQYYKQMPVSVSTLIRSLELRKYKEDNIRKDKIISQENEKDNKNIRYVNFNVDEDHNNNADKCFCHEMHYDFLKHKFKIYIKQNNKTKDHIIGKTIKHGEKNNFEKSVMNRLISEEMKNEIVICNICNFRY